MKLPRIGCTVSPEGKIIWAWKHPENMEFVDGEFDAFPPHATDPDGNVIEIGFAPGHTLMFLDDHLHHKEMHEIMNAPEKIRFRKQDDGTWRLRHIQIDPMTGEKTEEDHPFQTRIEKRSLERKKANKETRIIEKVLGQIHPKIVKLVNLFIVVSFSSLLFLSFPSFANAEDRVLQVRDHEALWTYCVENWSSHAYGTTFCGWALVNGYPGTAPDGEKSCMHAQRLGEAYFPLLQVTSDVAGLYCEYAVEVGPMFLSGW